MDEPRQHDAAASLTDCVRQFRRVARLAAADPLRLLPLDPLTQLASLSAPVTTLIDLAPFERLRHAVAAAPATPRHDPPRMRLQPLASAGHDVRAKPAAGSAPLSQVTSRNAAPPDARREPSSSTAASTMTLAERRAALRRRTVDAGSSPRSSSPLAAQAAAATGSRSTSPHEASEIAVGGRSRRGGNEEIGDQTLRTRPMPVDPLLFERDHETSPASDPLASAALDRGTYDALLADDPRAGSAPSNPSSAPGPLAEFEIPAGRDMLAAAVRRDPNDPGLSAVAYAPSSPVAGRWSPGTRADAGAAPRRPAWEPPGESELADALFETLYRDGVDLPWP